MIVNTNGQEMRFTTSPFDRCSNSNGDSGGPLLQYDDTGSPILIGVTSASYKCGAAGYPTLFVRLSAFRDFLPFDEIETPSETVKKPKSKTRNAITKVLVYSFMPIIGIIISFILIFFVTRYRRVRSN